MITHSQDVDWVSIAEQVSVEMDSGKLAILVKRLCSRAACSPDSRVGLDCPVLFASTQRQPELLH
jgi:hypothetical protein